MLYGPSVHLHFSEAYTILTEQAIRYHQNYSKSGQQSPGIISNSTDTTEKHLAQQSNNTFS